MAKNNKSLSINSGYPEEDVLLTAQPQSHRGACTSHFLSLRLSFFTQLVVKVCTNSRFTQFFNEGEKGTTNDDSCFLPQH